MNNSLTRQQADFLKDLLKTIGKDDGLNQGIAASMGLDEDAFNDLADSAFTNLGNGRLTVE